MRRHLILMVEALTVAAVGVVAAPQAAQAEGCHLTSSGAVICSGHDSGGPPGQDPGGGGGAPIDPALLDPTIVDGPGGTPCVTSTYDPAGAVPGLPNIIDGIVDTIVQTVATVLGYGACPGAAPIPTPTEVAQSYFNRSELPGPDVTIEPGHGVVVLPVYVQSGAKMTWEKHIGQTLYGPLDITANSELFVNWGDGTLKDKGPYTVPGASYAKGGGISHPYAKDGRFDITVRQVWTVKWQFGPAAGTFPPVEKSDTVANFQILQLQSVTD